MFKVEAGRSERVVEFVFVDVQLVVERFEEFFGRFIVRVEVQCGVVAGDGSDGVLTVFDVVVVEACDLVAVDV